MVPGLRWSCRIDGLADVDLLQSLTELALWGFGHYFFLDVILPACHSCASLLPAVCTCLVLAPVMAPKLVTCSAFMSSALVTTSQSFSGHSLLPCMGRAWRVPLSSSAQVEVVLQWVVQS